MSRYVEILATQNPFDAGPDSSNRDQLSCNYQFTAADTPTAFESEVAQLLVTAGLGTLYNSATAPSGNIFLGRKVPAPAGAGPLITIIATSGFAPLETHDGSKYQRLSCQIVVRASSYPVARTRAMAIWNELDGKRDVTVTAP